MSSDKVIKAGIGYTIGNYLLKGLSFLSVPVFSKLLSTTEYGRYNTFVSYEGILFVLIGAAIHSSYKNARYKYGTFEENVATENDYHTFVSVTILFEVISFAVWLLTVNILGNVLSSWLGLDLLSLNLLVVYSFSTAILTCYNTDISIRYQYKSFLVIAGLNAVGNILLSVFLVLTLFNNDRYMGRIIGTALPVFLIAMYIVWYYWRNRKPKHVKSFLKWGLSYSLPIVPHGISQVILSRFDVIMITRMIGEHESGIYSFAYNIFMIVSVTMTSLSSAWSPWFYERMHEKNYESIKKYSRYYILGIAVFCALLILLGPELIFILSLGSSKYAASVYCSIPIIAGGFFAFLYNLPADIEYYYGKTKFIALGTTLAAVINIVLNAIFIQKYGYIAAAYTTLVTYALYFVFHYLLYRHIEKEKVFSLAAILVSVFIVMISSGIALVTIGAPLIRIGLALILLAVLLVYFEKTIKVFSILYKKLRRR